MARDASVVVGEMLEAAGFEITRSSLEIGGPGLSVHELGTACMGDDSSTSVLNGFNRTWDIDNVYVTDGSSFTSGGFQNPTLTMMALTVRACHHIVGRLKRGMA